VRIAYVFNYVGGISGSEEQALQLIPALARLRGLEVHAVSSLPTGAPKSFCIEKKDSKLDAPLWFPGNSWVECFSQINPDIVLQHSMAIDLCRELIKARNRLKFKLAFRAGANILENFLVWPYRREPEPNFWYLTQALSHYDIIIAPSRVSANELSFLYNRQVHWIPVGIDIETYIPTDYMADDILKILGASRHEVNNYFPVVFNALRRLAKKYDISVKIISEGTFTNVYNNIIHRYRLEDVVSLTGWLDAYNKIKAFEVADVTVTPSITHMGIPVSVLESAAGGCVSLVSDLPVYDDVKVPVRLRLDSFIEWYEALEKCIVDKDWAKEKIKQGLKEVENFRVDKIARVYKKLFEGFV